MNALIVYDSQFGNTERIARAIAERLGSAQLLRAEDAGALERTACDLLIVAGPTQRHGASVSRQGRSRMCQRPPSTPVIGCLGS